MELIYFVAYTGIILVVCGSSGATVFKRDDPPSKTCIKVVDGRCKCCASGWRNESSNCTIRCDSCTNSLIKEVCQRQCKPGLWGEDCTKTCPQHCAKTQGNVPYCEKDKGNCDKGCQPGYYGIRCNNTCSTNCVKDCWTNGTCINCRDGFYGDTCAYPCSQGCGGNRCTRDGNCSCIQGWKGNMCDEYIMKPSDFPYIERLLQQILHVLNKILWAVIIGIVFIFLICCGKFTKPIKQRFRRTFGLYKSSNNDSSRPLLTNQNQASNDRPPIKSDNEDKQNDIEEDSVSAKEMEHPYSVEVAPHDEDDVFDIRPKKNCRNGTTAETPV